MQTVPLPRVWVAWLSPQAEALHFPAETVAISLDTAQTQYQLLLGMSYTIAFLLGTVLLNTRARVRTLLWAVVISGACQAAYGTLMTLSGLEYGFFVEKYVGTGLATGTFINRNHFAGYLVIALAAGIGLLITRLGREHSDTPRARLRALLTLLLSSKFLLRLLLALMVIGLVLSRSRMGNLSFFLALMTAGSVLLLSARRAHFGKVALLLASLVLVDLLIVGRWFGADEVAERLMATSTQTESRDEVATFSLGIVRDYFWTGSGMGTFYTVFPRYSGAALEGDYYSHAHNDYLELAGDLGVPAFTLLGIFLILNLRKSFSLQYHSNSRFFRGIALTLLMCVLWCLFHSLVDFNLYIPANALTLMALLALAWLDRRAFEEKGE